MARIRSLKPEMWQSETFGTVSIEAQALFVGLITQADDDGRIKGSAARMRAILWPYKTDLDAARVEEWLDELQSADLVVRYEADEKQYLALSGWHEHQKIDHPRSSQLPAPDAPLARIREDSRGLGPDQGSRIKEGDQGKGANAPVEPSSTNGAGQAQIVRELFAYWQQRCSHEGAKFTDGRKRKLAARLREGYTVEQIRVAIDGAAVAPYVNDAGKRFDDIELVCRNGEKLELFIERGQQAVEDTPAALAARMRDRQAA